MKQDGENASDGLHSSKRLRLSTLRSQNRGRFRGLSDSAGPSHGASTSSSDVNLPSVSYRGVQVGTTADVRESSIEAEPTSLSDYPVRHSPQNTSLIGTDDDSAPGNEENFSHVSDTRQQSIEAGNDLLDIPSEVRDDVAIQHRELHARQLEDGTVHSLESIPVEPDTEVSAISGGPVGPPHGHDVSPSAREEETDNALACDEVSGDGRSNHLEQEANLTRFQEMEPEVRPLVSQQQDETLSHNVATFGQSGTLILGREYQHFFIKLKWRFSFVS